MNVLESGFVPIVLHPSLACHVRYFFHDLCGNVCGPGRAVWRLGNVRNLLKLVPLRETLTCTRIQKS